MTGMSDDWSPWAPQYFDQDGEPITLDEWARQFEDTEGRRIGHDVVGPYRISTVWLGMNHAFLGGPPLIFETMVFGPADIPAYDIDMRRYHTKAAAIAGHAGTVLLVRATTQSLDEMLHRAEPAAAQTARLPVDGHEYRRRRLRR